MNPDVRTFRTIVDHYLEGTFERFPEHASDLGIKEYEPLLGKNDPETHKQHIVAMRDALNAVEALPEYAFSGDDWLDRRGFLSMMRTGLLSDETLGRWRTNPQAHPEAAVNSIFMLLVRNTDNLRRVQPAIESRLKKIPAYLEAGLSCIKEPIPLWTKLAHKVCEGAQSFLTGLAPTFPGIEKAHFDTAAKAFAKYANGLDRKRPGSPTGFCIGRENFEYLVRERLGLTWSVPEIEAMGRRLVEQLGEEVKREAAKFGRKPAREIIEAAAAQWTPSGPLLEEYQKTTEKMKERFADAGTVTFPEGDRLKVLPVPDFLRHQFPTAAYTAPPPYAKDQTGIFWVNDLSLVTTDPARKVAEIRQHFGLELTSAHEAYPGHHLQFALQNRHKSKLRRLFAHSIFYEGWTLWCEKLCVEHEIYDAPHARLMQLNDALWRAHRILIDCGLHSGRLNFNGAVNELVEGVGFTKARAAGDVNWYTSSPTVPMSYLLGRLELERLHRRVTTREGWSLRQFNDWILSFGAIPWSWIWQSRLHQAG